MTFENLTLFSDFIINMWVRMTSDGSLFTISDDQSATIIDWNISGGNMYLTLPSSEISELSFQIPMLDWVQLSLEFSRNGDNTQISFYYNGTMLNAFTVENFILYDSNSNEHIIGEQYSGFVFRWAYYADVDKSHLTSDIITDHTCPQVNHCTACPVDECLIDCDWDQLLDDNNMCEDCLPECDGGCVRLDNCDPCLIVGCAECESFDVCDSCAGGSPPDESGECACDAGFYFDLETNTCLPCHESCATCKGGSNLDCTGCKEGSYLQQDPTENPDINTCDTECPTGALVIDDEYCSYEGNYFSLMIRFNMNVSNYGDSSGPGSIYGGTSVEDEAADPVPTFLRGLHFNGSQYLTMI